MVETQRHNRNADVPPLKSVLYGALSVDCQRRPTALFAMTAIDESSCAQASATVASRHGAAVLGRRRFFAPLDRVRLLDREEELEGRERSVAVQGNRIALHLVFRNLDLSDVHEPEADWETRLESVPAKTNQVLDLMIQHVEAEYAGNYITSLFKNAGRCEHLVRLVKADVEASKTGPDGPEHVSHPES